MAKMSLTAGFKQGPYDPKGQPTLTGKTKDVLKASVPGLTASVNKTQTAGQGNKSSK
jgi:hypothetical protein